MSKPPFNAISFAPAEVIVDRLPDGAMLLRSPTALNPYPRCLGDLLEHWAEAAPDRVFLAERSPAGGWRRLTFAEVRAAARSIAQALLDRGLTADRPIAILSDNSVNSALLQLGAMHAGIPPAPVSPAYSLMSQDFGKLKLIVDLLAPGMVFAADGTRFARALEIVDFGEAEIVVASNPPEGRPTTDFASLLAAAPTDAVDAAFARVGPDTVAKILFTSGSTGYPKGVLNTQRMLCSNQQAIAQLWPFLEEAPPVIVDWLPWSHTFGANHNFNMMLRNGGSLYIDGGKPMPGLVETTVENLKEISPTLYFNVPRGFDMVLPYLEADAALRDNFFKDLRLIFYAAAALPQNLWERLEAVAIQARGERVRMVSAWGSTETAPLATSVHFEIEKAGVIGLPAPGTEIKMVPSGDKLELRVRGPNVTPGYLKRDDLTAAAFDEDGFYRIGDAGKFDDPDDPAKGIVFDGRVAEDFKLTSGTWVHAGSLRIAAIAAGAPVIQDAVVAGHDREDIGLLIFPNPAGCLSVCPDIDGDTPLADLIARPELRARVRDGLFAYNAANPANSTRIARAILMAEPPSIDANEITDKGYLNQRAVLDCRAALVEKLYADDPDDAVILISP